MATYKAVVDTAYPCNLLINTGVFTLQTSFMVFGRSSFEFSLPTYLTQNSPIS